MKIPIRDIPQSGLEFTKQVSPSEIGLSQEDLACTSPLDVSAKLERISNAVSAHAAVSVRFRMTCARCLDDIERDRHEQYTFTYMIDGNTDYIDLGEDIRQEMIIGIPAKDLCREDCKGICPNCGASLNKEACKCQVKAPLKK